MGRKLKTGKQRKDRYYHLAKETGYRSRAAFKLIQLNRKFEFLQRSKVLIDLCAAPGGWLQVAQKYMPVSSVVIGVDLVPIKQIHNVITIQDDITTKHCRNELSRELKTWKADVVLHDGAPNVGKSWLHDSFNQNRLTLSALSLATEFLMKGGWFVTKVFRSKDYNALMWTFKKLFQKVHATKPQASRNESAEIFVVCQNYIAPDKIDPKFFDPTFVFEDIDLTVESEKKTKSNLLKPPTKVKKTKAEGYADGDYTLYHKLNASEFITSSNHIELLSACNEIVIDTTEIAKHPLTTSEITECCKDTKVLGRKELLAIIGWRRKLKAELYKEDKPKKEESIEMNDEISETDEIDEQIDEEAKDIKRKKRKILKEKRKLNERMNLKMVLKNDQLVDEELELFQLKNIRNKAQLSKVEEIDLSDVEIDANDNESGDETYIRSNKVVFDKEEKRLYDSDDSEDENMDSNSDNEGFGHEENHNELSDDENDGLVVDLKDKEESKRDKTKMFFENKIFQDEMNEDDDDLELELIENKLKPNKFSKHSKSNENNFEKDEYSSSSDEENESKKKKRNNDKVNDKCKKKVKLSPEELALGTLMVKSQKTKRDLLDNAWNRYTHEDDEFLPSWFRKDEEKYNKKPLPVTEDMVREYKQQLREINARPIKKVAEAKARNKKKALRRLEKARKRAESVTNAPDMSNKEKAEHIKSAYKKALKGNKKNVTYVVAKKHQGKKRPQGVKGRYKVVDPRMKKDKRLQNNNKSKSNNKKSKPNKKSMPKQKRGKSKR